MIRRSFLRDSRVFEVPLDEIELVKNSESVEFTLNIYPIQGLDYSTISNQTKFITPDSESIPDTWDYADDIDV